MKIIQGQGVSKGIEQGTIYFYHRAAAQVEMRTGADEQEERARLERAKERTAQQLSDMAEKAREEAGDEAAVLFETHAMFLEDEDYTGAMDELLAQSDFVSVHAPAVDGGALISAENIAKMKDGVVIINTSRGTNVDEAALLAALESGKVRAAGLDVYADEPATNKALYSHPMVSCTPHIGAATVEAQKRIGSEIVDIIKSF